MADIPPDKENDVGYYKIALEVTENALKREKRERGEDWGRYLRWFPCNTIVRLPEFPDWKLTQIIVDKHGKEWIFQGFTLHRRNDTGDLVLLVRVSDTLVNPDLFDIKLGKGLI